MDLRRKKILTRNAMYTILKYLDDIDFSKIFDKDALGYRYLLLNLIALKDDQEERKKLRNGMTKK